MFTEESAVGKAISPGPVIVLAGVNHRTAAVAVREKFALSGEHRERALDTFLGIPSVDEAVVISTCNRTEIVVCSHRPIDSDILVQQLEGAIARSVALPRRALMRCCYWYTGREAARHLFRVVCGLDSMIVGEPQILGQVKESFQCAADGGTTRAILNRLFHRAFTVAKCVRTETAIGRNGVSVGYAARELAVQIFGSLDRATVLLIGAGETGELVLKHLQSGGVRRVIVANRTLMRGERLAEAAGSTPIALGSIAEFLPQCDIVIGCAAVSEPILTLDDVERAQRKRSSQAQFFIDLGVPRNFTPDMASLPEVFLYNIDDLREAVRESIDSRRAAAAEAEVIVDRETERFDLWLAEREDEEAIRDVLMSVGEMTEVEVERTLRRLDARGVFRDDLTRASTHRMLSQLVGAVVAKIFHHPIEALRSTAQTMDAQQFRRIFLGASLQRVSSDDHSSDSSASRSADTRAASS